MRCVAAIAWCCGTSAMGCLNEYHPEYHPETSYSYTQNVVTVAAPPPAPAPTVVYVSVSLPSTTASSAPGAAHGPARGQRAPRTSERDPTPPPRAAQLAPMFASDESRGSGE